jgi:hypothetical protein
MFELHILLKWRPSLGEFGVDQMITILNSDMQFLKFICKAPNVTQWPTVTISSDKT